MSLKDALCIETFRLQISWGWKEHGPKQALGLFRPHRSPGLCLFGAKSHDDSRIRNRSSKGKELCSCIISHLGYEAFHLRLHK